MNGHNVERDFPTFGASIVVFFVVSFGSGMEKLFLLCAARLYRWYHRQIEIDWRLGIDPLLKLFGTSILWLQSEGRH